MTRQQIVNAPFLYVNNLKVTWASNTTLTLGTGVCRDSTNTFDMTIAATKTINAATTGINALDTGTFAASKCYAVHVVGDSSGYSTTGALLSLSATAPTLPTGYDIFRRVGWAFSDGSTHFLLLHHVGNGSTKQFFYDEPVSALSGGTSATFAAVALTEKVPAIAKLPVLLQLDLTPNAANDAGYVRMGGSSATNGAVMYGSVAAKKSSQGLTVVSDLVTAAPTIEYKVTASGSLNALILGFTDYI
jgi:hypothetical protein